VERLRRILRAWFTNWEKPRDEETKMPADRSVAELERFLAERADHLLRTAVLLAGSKEAGEDLLQTAVERLLRRWRRFDGDPEGYLRRTLCNLAIDGHRRAGRWRQKERLLWTGLRHTQDPAGDVDLRDALVRLLLQLPAKQRAVLVLRYWEQLTDAEAAAVLGCAEGTVRSAVSRGLTRMRELADDWSDTAVCGREDKRS
jgi:RNA polymerase sigma-70 factor (sigma-E family)